MTFEESVPPKRIRRQRPLRLALMLERSRDLLRAARTEIEVARTYSTSLAERLEQREAFAHAILDGVDLGIVTADARGMVTFVNRTARELLDPECAFGGPVGELLGLDESPETLLGSKPHRTIAYRLTTRDGDQLDLDLSVSRPASTAHAQIGFFFIFRDTRDEKQRSLERERLERLAAMGTMVAGFAHEVRNPVASLRSLTESLGEELSDAKIALPHVGRMLQVLERIERLVRTSLQFGRPSTPRRERCRPWSIVATAMSELAPRTGAQAGELCVRIDPDLPDVFVDDAQLVQVLVILLNNALDAVVSAPHVWVEVTEERMALDRERDDDASASSRREAPPRMVRFTVRDDGPGIPAEILGRIFDPFFTTKAAGTGLGLSIAQQIVSENGGMLEVTSRRGATAFAVLVPAPAHELEKAGSGRA